MVKIKLTHILDERSQCGGIPCKSLSSVGVTLVAALFLFLSVSPVNVSSCHAAEGATFQSGLRILALPVGTFEIGYGGGTSRVDAYPALGVSPYLDWLFRTHFFVGIQSEVLLNVIPKIGGYVGATAINAQLRLGAMANIGRAIGVYAVASPGYSTIRAGRIGNPRGLVFEGLGGVKVRVSANNALFVESGYLAGFQRVHGEPGLPAFGQYSPSYVVAACGWQITF
jgi:hypothetical protein